ncbi:MAG: acyltransferase, partial [Croceibacterium sp.]
DLFFVISGLVMVHTTSDRPVRPGEFIVNRLIRIVPLYWAATLAIYAIALIAPTFVKATGTAVDELVKSLLFIPFRKSNGLIQPVLFPGWTLNYEMFFYVLFAAGLAMRSVVLRVTLVCSVLAAFVAVGAVFTPAGAIGQFYASPLVLEFGYGMTIGLIVPRLRPHPVAGVLAGMAIAAGIGWIVLYPQVVPVVPLRVVSIGLPAAAVVLGAIQLERQGYVWQHPGMLLLGAASYALYLTHPFVLTALEKTAVSLGFTHGMLLAGVMIVSMALAIGVAVAINLVFERPVDRYLRRRFGRARGLAAQSEAAALWPWRQGRDEDTSQCGPAQLSTAKLAGRNGAVGDVKRVNSRPIDDDVDRG